MWKNEHWQFFFLGFSLLISEKKNQATFSYTPNTVDTAMHRMLRQNKKKVSWADWVTAEESVSARCRVCVLLGSVPWYA